MHIRFLASFVLLAANLFGQMMEGELRLTFRDPQGNAVPARVELDSRNPPFHAAAQANSAGVARLGRLPLGVYRLTVAQPGLRTYEETVEVRSAVPQARTITLQLEVVATTLTVTQPVPLLDRSQPALLMQQGQNELDETLGTTLGRSTIDVVTTLPGWLLEANAVLHPRGSEYDTQYVIDGMPLYDNRSIGFAPPFENQEFSAVSVLTAGIPAEYGRRLGGVIALDTRRRDTLGSTSDLQFQSGSYGTNSGAFSQHYRTTQTAVSLGLNTGMTDRYLDPPSLENYTNEASTVGMNARLDRDLTERDRLSLYLRSNKMNFLVPNDLEQQEAGQRQDRRSTETAGQVHYQHVFSARTVASVRGMVRDLTARLWSNAFSTPVHVDQDRGFREGAVIAAFTRESEHHTLKFGGDFRTASVRERFAVDFLQFNGQQRSTETSAFVQDHLRWGNFAANLGFRVDHYRFLINDTAFSPRVALSYYIPQADLLLRGAYDRVFQPPAFENLLFSSAAPSFGLGDVTGNLAVPPSRGNFYEVGIRKPLGNVLRLDVSHYWRIFRNYLDDDVFLNTGLGFPITFDTARIQGTEVRLEMPRFRRFSSYVSYSNMHGTATSPVTGGLFVRGGEAEELRDGVERFPITQDQRNTVASRLRYEPHPNAWVATEIRYGSGLPVELEDDDDDHEEQPIPQPILDQVDFERGRIRPNFNLNLSTGVRLWNQDGRTAALQVDLRNATNRLNVINFSGLFSGTALAPGRQATLQLRFRF